MVMWLVILLATLLVSIAGVIYLITRVSKFNVVMKLAEKCRIKTKIMSTLIAIVFVAVCWWIFEFVNLCVILIHMMVFWLVCEAGVGIYNRIKYGSKTPNNQDKTETDILGKNDVDNDKNKANVKDKSNIVNAKDAQIGRVYWAGTLALIISVLYLGYGWYTDRHVVITEYNIKTEKAVEPLKILQFSDSHMGTTFNGEEFAKHIETMKALKPDIVLMTGDYIDGSSKLEDILTSLEAYGTLKPRLGSYFIFGNHDKNHYGEDQGRDYTTDDFTKALKEQGIIVLEDEVIDLGNGYTIVGRKDKSEPSRASIAELMTKVKEGSFVIDMNHQPNDYAAEEAAGVDLVLSGHTHGGQLFPIINAGIWMGANDKTYGYEKREDTNFIVSSGISDWAIDFKTGCVSEIVIINVGN